MARAAASAPAEDRVMATSRTAEAAQPHDNTRLSFVCKPLQKKPRITFEMVETPSQPAVSPRTPRKKEQQKPPPER